MNYAYLIHTYLEGRLEEPLEDVLFAELSRDGALRKELAAQINLAHAARRDAASITPTDAEKNALFAELGLSSGTLVSSAEGITALSSISSVLPALQSVVFMLLSSLALMVGLRSDALWESGATNSLKTGLSAIHLPVFSIDVPKERVTSRVSSNAPKASNNGHSSSMMYAAQVLLPNNTTEAIFGENSVPTNDDAKGDVGTTQAPMLPPSISSALSLPPATLLLQVKQPTAFSRTNPRPHPAFRHESTEDASMIEQFPVQLGVRHLLGGGTLGLHGIVQYALNKQQAVGFEGGTEAARLLVRNARSGEVGMLNASEESVFSGTAYYRHTFTNFALLPNKALVPFVQGGIGVMGRCGALQGMGGFRFDVAPELSFTLSAELKMPVFYAEQHFQSKTGVSIGMQYHISDR